MNQSLANFGAVIVLAAALLAVFLAANINAPEKATGARQQPIGETATSASNNSAFEQGFLNRGLKTNTAKSSIKLSKVLSGGPGKDGIPAIREPVFVPVSEKPESVSFDTDGIVLGKEQPKFYPYNIMIWHEIVNDTVDGVPVAVTFCPLCGSAIVFGRRVGGETVSFGVSGLLYQSNLLMYDSKTESLWSQVLGEAVVGEYTETKLLLLPSSVVSFRQFEEQFPNGLVLSDKTGYARDYSFNPYGNYDKDPSTFFPVDSFGDRLPAKELLLVVPLEDKTVAFVLSKLNEKRSAELVVDGEKLEVTVGEGGLYSAIFRGEEKPTFVAMYFSVAVHNPGMVIWAGE
ncbi:MAG TPA: DUF3179 domain-containing protein [archaeon]|nr:DUF3179 domain-containing protein [archaeon]